MPLYAPVETPLITTTRTVLFLPRRFRSQLLPVTVTNRGTDSTIFLRTSAKPRAPPPNHSLGTLHHRQAHCTHLSCPLVTSMATLWHPLRIMNDQYPKIDTKEFRLHHSVPLVSDVYLPTLKSLLHWPPEESLPLCGRQALEPSSPVAIVRAYLRRLSFLRIPHPRC